MYPLELKIQPSAWRIFNARKNDPAFGQFAEKILRRDRYTCRYCGFQARDYMEIINLDQNYYNNRSQNMVAACPFCAQCFFLESTGVSYGGGTLIALPEISQSLLNNLCHVLFCAISINSSYKSPAQSLYRTLKFRSKPIEQLYGEGMSEPATFAQMVIDTLGPESAIPEGMLDNIRLLPSRARFKTEIDRWAQTSMVEVLPA